MKHLKEKDKGSQRSNFDWKLGNYFAEPDLVETHLGLYCYRR